MIDSKFNFSKLLSNYLYCKALDEFLKNKDGFYETSDYVLAKGLVESLKSSNSDMNSTLRFKVAFAYLINQYAAFLKTKSEDNFYPILSTLFNKNIDTVTSIDIITELRQVTLKKAKFLFKKDFFVKYKENIEELIEQNEFLFREIDQEQDYGYDEFYQELTEIFKTKIGSKNTSVLFEITKSYNLNKEQDDEIELLNAFNSFSKRKFKTENCDEELSQSMCKKLKTREIYKGNEIESLSVQVDFDPNNDDLPSLSPVIPIQGRNSDFPFEEPTGSKVYATRISPRTLDKQPDPANKKNLSLNDKLDFESSSDDDFEIPSDKFRKVRMPTKRLAEAIAEENSKMTSSPKPSTSRNASRLSNLNEDSDLMSENKNNKSKTKRQSKKLKKSEIKSQDEEEEEESKKSTNNKSKAVKKNKDSSFSSISDLSDNSDNESKPKVKMNQSVQGKRTKWTENETIYLVVGVDLYGKGNWAKILKRFNDKIKNRTTVHLKDKYRNLERSNELRRFEKIAKAFIEKNKISVD